MSPPSFTVKDATTEETLIAVDQLRQDVLEWIHQSPPALFQSPPLQIILTPDKNNTGTQTSSQLPNPNREGQARNYFHFSRFFSSESAPPPPLAQRKKTYSEEEESHACYFSPTASAKANQVLRERWMGESQSHQHNTTTTTRTMQSSASSLNASSTSPHSTGGGCAAAPHRSATGSSLHTTCASSSEHFLQEEAHWLLPLLLLSPTQAERSDATRTTPLQGRLWKTELFCPTSRRGKPAQATPTASASCGTTSREREVRPLGAGNSIPSLLPILEPYAFSSPLMASLAAAAMPTTSAHATVSSNSGSPKERASFLHAGLQMQRVNLGFKLLLLLLGSPSISWRRQTATTCGVHRNEEASSLSLSVVPPNDSMTSQHPMCRRTALLCEYYVLGCHTFLTRLEEGICWLAFLQREEEAEDALPTDGAETQCGLSSLALKRWKSCSTLISFSASYVLSSIKCHPEVIAYEHSRCSSATQWYSSPTSVLGRLVQLHAELNRIMGHTRDVARAQLLQKTVERRLLQALSEIAKGVLIVMQQPPPPLPRSMSEGNEREGRAAASFITSDSTEEEVENDTCCSSSSVEGLRVLTQATAAMMLSAKTTAGVAEEGDSVDFPNEKLYPLQSSPQGETPSRRLFTEVPECKSRDAGAPASRVSSASRCDAVGVLARVLAWTQGIACEVLRPTALLPTHYSSGTRRNDSTLIWSSRTHRIAALHALGVLSAWLPGVSARRMLSEFFRSLSATSRTRGSTDHHHHHTNPRETSTTDGKKECLVASLLERIQELKYQLPLEDVWGKNTAVSFSTASQTPASSGSAVLPFPFAVPLVTSSMEFVTSTPFFFGGEAVVGQNTTVTASSSTCASPQALWWHLFHVLSHAAVSCGGGASHTTSPPRSGDTAKASSESHGVEEEDEMARSAQLVFSLWLSVTGSVLLATGLHHAGFNALHHTTEKKALSDGKTVEEGVSVVLDGVWGLLLRAWESMRQVLVLLDRRELTSTSLSFSLRLPIVGASDGRATFSPFPHDGLTEPRRESGDATRWTGLEPPSPALRRGGEASGYRYFAEAWIAAGAALLLAPSASSPERSQRVAAVEHWSSARLQASSHALTLAAFLAAVSKGGFTVANHGRYDVSLSSVSGVRLFRALAEVLAWSGGTPSSPSSATPQGCFRKESVSESCAALMTVLDFLVHYFDQWAAAASSAGTMLLQKNGHEPTPDSSIFLLFTVLMRLPVVVSVCVSLATQSATSKPNDEEEVSGGEPDTPASPVMVALHEKLSLVLASFLTLFSAFAKQHKMEMETEEEEENGVSGSALALPVMRRVAGLLLEALLVEATSSSAVHRGALELFHFASSLRAALSPTAPPPSANEGRSTLDWARGLIATMLQEDLVEMILPPIAHPLCGKQTSRCSTASTSHSYHHHVQCFLSLDSIWRLLARVLQHDRHPSSLAPTSPTPIRGAALLTALGLSASAQTALAELVFSPPLASTSAMLPCGSTVLGGETKEAKNEEPPDNEGVELSLSPQVWFQLEALQSAATSQCATAQEPWKETARTATRKDPQLGHLSTPRGDGGRNHSAASSSFHLYAETATEEAHSADSVLSLLRHTTRVLQAFHRHNASYEKRPRDDEHGAKVDAGGEAAALRPRKRERRESCGSAPPEMTNTTQEREDRVLRTLGLREAWEELTHAGKEALYSYWS